ncbi:MAG: sigma-70 family RNA polymerase sigma factor [Phycisphaerae bacterium]|nr:sigma-70 family RNA polymerase sigma factor [Phycisphaerae bacterium]
MINRVDRSVEQIVDEILVMDCQSGRVKALEILVSRWQKRLWRYAFRLIGDSEAAWDITQESWLGIIRGISRLNDPARFRPWAYKIVTNKTHDWIRKSITMKQTGSDRFDKLRAKEVQDHRQPQNNDTGVRELLEKLDMRKKVVLSLYYFEQLTVPEIGAALKIPDGTVKSRLHNARNELKRLWQKHCE